MNLWYFVFVAFYLIVHVPLLLVLAVLYPYEQLFDRVRRRATYRAFWIYARIVTAPFFGTKVTGKPMDEIEEPVVFVCNHQTAWDHVFSFLYRKNMPHVMMKASVGNYPCIGLSVRAMDSIFVYTRQPDQGKPDPRNAIAIQKAKDLLQNKVSVAIFPEGSRRFMQFHDYKEPMKKPGLEYMREQALKREPNSIGPFRVGAFKLARETHTKIVPLVMETRHLLNDRLREARRGTMLLHVGEPIDPDEFSSEEDLIRYVHGYMEEQLAKLQLSLDANLILSKEESTASE